MINILKRKKMDFTEGPLFWRLLIFMVPIVLSALLQVLYDTADKIVVGRYSGDPNALGAIGSTTFISGLLINFMIGVGAGAGVVVAQAFGAKRHEDVSRSTHNAFILSLGLSVVISIVAFITAAPFLRLLGTKEELFDSALLYIRIIYTSIFATAVYNVGVSVLRAVGDSATSLRIGMISGLINVVLNLFFVLVCKMSVDGVAIATVISKYYSAIAIVYDLYKRKGESYAFSFKKLIPNRAMILRMLRLGIPTGIQSSCFALANLASTAAINSFDGTIFISARSIGTDIDHISSAIAGGFMPAALSATGQNAGARKNERIRRIFWYSMLQSFVIVGLVSNTLRIFSGDIAKLFIGVGDENLEAKLVAVEAWCGVMLVLHFLTGILNAATGVVRGLGYSVLPLMFNLIGTVGGRLLWIYGFFYNLPVAEKGIEEFKFLAYMYPISWGATMIMIIGLCIVAFIRLNKNMTPEEKQAERERIAASASR